MVTILTTRRIKTKHKINRQTFSSLYIILFEVVKQEMARVNIDI